MFASDIMILGNSVVRKKHFTCVHTRTHQHTGTPSFAYTCFVSWHKACRKCLCIGDCVSVTYMNKEQQPLCKHILTRRKEHNVIFVKEEHRACRMRFFHLARARNKAETAEIVITACCRLEYFMISGIYIFGSVNMI